MLHIFVRTTNRWSSSDWVGSLVYAWLSFFFHDFCFIDVIFKGNSAYVWRPLLTGGNKLNIFDVTRAKPRVNKHKQIFMLIRVVVVRCDGEALTHLSNLVYTKRTKTCYIILYLYLLMCRKFKTDEETKMSRYKY